LCRTSNRHANTNTDDHGHSDSDTHTNKHTDGNCHGHGHHNKRNTVSYTNPHACATGTDGQLSGTDEELPQGAAGHAL
jgi:hypothetical protein